MRPIRYSMSLLYDLDGICITQDMAAAGDAVLDGALVSGGVVTLPQAQAVSVSSSANIATVVFTIHGTDRNGNEIASTITGVNNNTVASAASFLTVTRIAVSAGTGGSNFIAGVNASGASPVFGMDTNLNPFMATIGLSSFVGASNSVTVQYTLDNIFAPTFREATAAWYTHALSAQTSNAVGSQLIPVSGIRVVQTGAAVTAGVTVSIIQSGTTSA